MEARAQGRRLEASRQAGQRITSHQEQRLAACRMAHRSYVAHRGICGSAGRPETLTGADRKLLGHPVSGDRGRRRGDASGTARLGGFTLGRRAGHYVRSGSAHGAAHAQGLRLVSIQTIADGGLRDGRGGERGQSGSACDGHRRGENHGRRFRRRLRRHPEDLLRRVQTESGRLSGNHRVAQRNLRGQVRRRDAGLRRPAHGA